MWILAIPVGVLALLGAYRAAKMLNKLLRRTKVGANSEPISYGLVILTTAFMVVPWLVPPIGILRAAMTLAFVIYLGLGMDQIYRLYKQTRRAVHLTTVTVSSIAVGIDRETLNQSLLTVAALVASQAPEITQELATKMQHMPELVGAENSAEISKLQSRLIALTSEATDVFGKAGLLQDLEKLRSYPEAALQASQLARDLSKDSTFAMSNTLDEIDRALGLK